MNKIILFLERMWLTVAIVCAILAIYKALTIGLEDGMYFLIFALLAILLWYLRRRVRMRMQNTPENKDE